MEHLEHYEKHLVFLSLKKTASLVETSDIYIDIYRCIAHMIKGFLSRNDPTKIKHHALFTVLLMEVGSPETVP